MRFNMLQKKFKALLVCDSHAAAAKAAAGCDIYGKTNTKANSVTHAATCLPFWSPWPPGTAATQSRRPQKSRAAAAAKILSKKDSLD